MYKQGHYARIKQPSGTELYQDAAKILEAFLEKQLDDRLQASGRPKHRRPDRLPGGRRPITAGEVLDERAEFSFDEGIERCKTMPSRPRPSPDDKPKDSGLRNKLNRRDRSPGASSASSADTEGDGSLVSENRKKKSVFKKMKDRLRHAFHRDEREQELKSKGNGEEKVSPNKSKKKTSPKTSKGGKSVFKDKGSEKQSTLSKENGDSQPSVGGDSEKRRHTLDSKSSSQFSQIETNGKRRNTAGKAFLNSIRRSFSSGKKDRHRIADVQAGFADDRNESVGDGQPSLNISGTSDKSSTPSPHNGKVPARSQPSHNGGPHQTLGLPTGAVHDKSPSPFPHSTSTDSYYGTGGKSSSINSHISAHSHVSGGRNALDNPGDDIEFMDVDDSGMADMRKGLSGTHNIVKNGDFNNGDKQVTRGSGGHSSLQYQTSLMEDGDPDDDLEQPDGKGKLFDIENIPFHERTEEEKEELYGKIAQKLMVMGDHFAIESGMSDSETRPAGPAQAEGGTNLTELERQIMELLRDRGDSFAHKVDGVAEPMVEEMKAEMYDRFKQTVQHSLGNEVSWNHLAFLFYTTKGVVSAVGRGSQVAVRAKEMTLRYFSDKIAKWLMDQGGFDSVLSESDSELD